MVDLYTLVKERFENEKLHICSSVFDDKAQKFLGLAYSWMLPAFAITWNCGKCQRSNGKRYFK